MNRSDYWQGARFMARREFRNGWHSVDGLVANLRIGDQVFMKGKWINVIA
jgi:hypothetical protein